MEESVISKSKYTITCAWVFVLFALPASSQDDSLPNTVSDGDHYVLETLVGYDVVLDPRVTMQQVERLDNEGDRFRLLRDAVFPVGSSTIRIDVDISSKGVFAPAVELINAAKKLSRLGEIEKLVRQRKAADPKHALVVELLLAIASNDLDQACERIAKFEDLVVDPTTDDRDRGSELVALHEAIKVSELHEEALAIAYQLRSPVLLGSGQRRKAWARHLISLCQQLEASVKRKLSEKKGEAIDPRVSRWRAVERTTAESLRLGYPPIVWDIRKGFAQKTGGHDRDFLYFDTPLTGDFSVEATLSSFNFREIGLGYGGVWASPNEDAKSLMHGTYAKDKERLAIEPALEEIGDSMHVQLQIKGDRRTTFVNGRPIYECAVSKSDPWLCAFGHWYTNGWVKDLRILGGPVIPNVIELATNKKLAGWGAFFGETVGEGCDWMLDLNGSGQPILIGKRQPSALVGSDPKRMIRYHRPVWEDAVISYQYYYQPNEMAVHPAIGDTVFFIGGNHLSLPSDQSTIQFQRPDTKVEALLRPNNWNDVSIQIKSDIVTVNLNDRPLLRHQLNDTNDRTLGMFHFADRSEARIRGLKWKGDWPQSIAPPHAQQLANNEIEDSVPELDATSQHFSHDFTEAMAPEAFHTSFVQQSQFVKRVSNGLKIEHGKDPHQTWLSPKIEISGDFDIEAEFDAFHATTVNNGDANIHLMAEFENHDAFVLYRKCSRYDRTTDYQLVQAARFHDVQGERHYEFPAHKSDASTNGRLRLSRRGDKMYYLYASNGSSNYRLLTTQSTPSAPLTGHGIRLIAATHVKGNVDVIWKRLSVRAQEISGIAILPKLTVTEIDASASKLKTQLIVDASDENALPKHTSRWGRNTQWIVGKEGLRIVGPGFDNWEEHTLASRATLFGDFDVTAELRVVKFPTPSKEQESIVTLQAEFRDQKKTFVEAKFSRTGVDEQRAVVLRRTLNSKGNFHYQPEFLLPFSQVTKLRIARRGRIAYFLAQEKASSETIVIGQLDVGRLPVQPSDIRFMLHTAGANREIEVVLKKLVMRADHIE